MELNTSQNIRACPECRELNPGTLVQLIDDHIKREFIALGLPGNAAEEIAEAVKRFNDTYHDEAEKVFKSVYTGEPMTEESHGKGKRSHPCSPSIEALFSIWHQGSGKARLRYHTTDNLAPCELFPNLLKDVYPPGLLSILSAWVQSN